MSENNNNKPNLPIAIPDPNQPAARKHLDNLSDEERERLKMEIHNGFLASYSYVDLEAMYGVSHHTIRKWAKDGKWELERDEAKKTSLFLLNSTQDQKLEKAGENLAAIVYLISNDGAKSIKDTGGLPERFPMKILIEAIDKLTRLKMHVSSGGVEKKASINVDLSQSVIQDVVMEIAIELERRYPQINSKELVSKLFNERLKKVLDKIK